MFHREYSYTRQLCIVDIRIVTKDKDQGDKYIEDNKI